MVGIILYLREQRGIVFVTLAVLGMYNALPTMLSARGSKAARGWLILLGLCKLWLRY